MTPNEWQRARRNWSALLFLAISTRATGSQVFTKASVTEDGHNFSPGEMYRRQSVWRRKVFIYLFYFDFIRFYFILFHFILILYSFYGAYMHVAYMQPCDSGTCARAQVRET